MIHIKIDSLGHEEYTKLVDYIKDKKDAMAEGHVPPYSISSGSIKSNPDGITCYENIEIEIKRQCKNTLKDLADLIEKDIVSHYDPGE